MHDLIDNLREDCCTRRIIVNGIALNEALLYYNINGACTGNGKTDWYPLNNIFALNNSIARPTGIVCHSCKNGNCIISLKTATKTYRYCNANNMNVR